MKARDGLIPCPLCCYDPKCPDSRATLGPPIVGAGGSIQEEIHCVQCAATGVRSTAGPRRTTPRSHA